MKNKEKFNNCAPRHWFSMCSWSFFFLTSLLEYNCFTMVCCSWSFYSIFQEAGRALHCHDVKMCSVKPRYALLGPKNFILNIKTTHRTSSIYNTLPSLHIELNFSIKTLVLRTHETVKISIKLTRYFTHSWQNNKSWYFRFFFVIVFKSVLMIKKKT